MHLSLYYRMTYKMKAMTPTLHISAAGVTSSPRSTSGAANSGVAKRTRRGRFGLYLRAHPKSMTFNSSDVTLNNNKFSG